VREEELHGQDSIEGHCIHSLHEICPFNLCTADCGMLQQPTDWVIAADGGQQPLEGLGLLHVLATAPLLDVEEDTMQALVDSYRLAEQLAEQLL
jgi:hypothetical protein